MEKPRIIIVEDEGLVALGLKEGLEHMGYGVPAITESGEDCLLKVRECKPDLVLMDIRLKGQMDGIEAAEIIRKKYFVPVIFLTAHSDESTLQRALVSESYGYIIKPFDEKALHAAIEVALYKSKGERKLKDSNEWFSMVFQSLGEGVVISDLAGSIRFINSTACVMLNRNEGECEGKRLKDIVELLDRKTMQKIDFNLAGIGSTNEILENQDCMLSTSDGEEIGVELTISPLINSTNNTLGVIVLFKAKKPLDKREEAARRELTKPIEIQQSLLPENGRVVSGVKIEWLFLPSRFGSGDLFNLFRLDDEHVGFYILDVMGHGFSAAIFAITLHNMLLPYPHGGFLLARPTQSSVPYESRRLPLAISKPSQVILDLNKRFLFETNTSPFFTIVYCIIDVQRRKATLARAGHMPPVIARGDGSIRRIESDGSAIGLFPELKVEEVEIDLGVGERLFFHTDGLVDSRNQDMQEYSYERLHGILEEKAASSTGELLSDLKASIVAWKDEEVFDDDIAFCVLSLEDE